ncbi:MAG: hypothetical protein NVS2B16_12110 [Chloroflexota bacterium]
MLRQRVYHLADIRDGSITDVGPDEPTKGEEKRSRALYTSTIQAESMVLCGGVPVDEHVKTPTGFASLGS